MVRKHRPFTKDECDFIKSHWYLFPKDWPGWQEKFPDRAWGTIRNKAYQLGSPNPRWSDSDDRKLLEALRVVAEELGRSPYACARRLHSLAQTSRVTNRIDSKLD